MQERRKQVRRQTDRDSLGELQRFRDSEIGTKEHKRKRRHAIRHACHAVIDLEIATAAGGSDEWNVSHEQIKGRVLDLSETGASLFVKHAVAMGQAFRLEIEMYDGAKVEAIAETRWTKSMEAKGGYAIGIEFTQLTPAHQQVIQNFLKDLEASAGL